MADDPAATGRGEPAPAGAAPGARWPQRLLALGVLAVAAVLAFGATGIAGDAGYAGIGPNVLPWVVAATLTVCGAMLLGEALAGGFASLPVPSGAVRGDWRAFAWMAGGILANALLIERIGFVLACALCFALAVRGLRLGEGRAGGGALRSVLDAATGLAIALPVFWMFTKGLGVNLPGLTGTGWL